VILAISSILIAKYACSAHRTVRNVMDFLKMIAQNAGVSYIWMRIVVYLNVKQGITLMKMICAKNVMIKNATLHR